MNFNIFYEFEKSNVKTRIDISNLMGIWAAQVRLDRWNYVLLCKLRIYKSNSYRIIVKNEALP